MYRKSLCFLYVFVGILSVFSKCTSSKHCITSISAIADSLIRSRPGFSQSYVEDQLENKSRVFNEICKYLSNESRLIIIDRPLQDIKAFYGLVYIYNTGQLFTYNQDKESFSLKEGYVYDRNGKLEHYLSTIKDSTIYKLEYQDKLKKIGPDLYATNVFYLDSQKKDFRLFVLW